MPYAILKGCHEVFNVAVLAQSGPGNIQCTFGWRCLVWLEESRRWASMAVVGNRAVLSDLLAIHAHLTRSPTVPGGWPILDGDLIFVEDHKKEAAPSVAI